MGKQRLWGQRDDPVPPGGPGWGLCPAGREVWPAPCKPQGQGREVRTFCLVDKLSVGGWRGEAPGAERPSPQIWM